MSFPIGCKWGVRNWNLGLSLPPPFCHHVIAVAALLKRDKDASQSWLRSCDYRPFLPGYSSQFKALLCFCLDFHATLHESSEEKRKWKEMEEGKNKEDEIKHGRKWGRRKSEDRRCISYSSQRCGWRCVSASSQHCGLMPMQRRWNWREWYISQLLGSITTWSCDCLLPKSPNLPVKMTVIGLSPI